MSQSNNAIQPFLDKYLLSIQKPGRYVGGEYNQIKKDWDSVETRVALAFPDIYDLGVSNLGLQILYELINQKEDCLAERVYSPWLDMESIMREHEIPLFSLENKQPIKDFDILGITLPYETIYTNTLNLLELSGLPLYQHERNDSHPLVMAGGHAAFNPEPMADFMDLFVIGDGEETTLEIIDTWKSLKGNQPRKVILEKLNQLDGVYVPSLYKPHYQPNGQIKEIVPVKDGIKPTVRKRFTNDIGTPSTKPLVPSINVVHNRVAVEIMRGCTRGCRFCHAGFITRPVRERSVDEIINIIDESLKNTGFEEVALLSLSSSDYSQINELVETLAKKYEGKNLRISLPSLRIETFSVELLNKLKGSRPGGFTLAPEAASDHMRSTINKPISSQQLLDTAREVYSRGWTTIKLYFMIGQPNETMEDVKAIADLCHSVIKVGRTVLGRKSKLNIGVSTFIPKAHTPFQWAAADTLENIEEKQQYLRKALRSPGMKFNWSDPSETILESFLSRGDRRLGKVIYDAWKNGAKFDAWQDQQHFEAWEKSLSNNQLDSTFYTHRVRNDDEIFPWDHIHTGVDKKYLLKEYQNAMSGITTQDCREGCLACGILTQYKDVRSANDDIRWHCLEVITK